MIYFLAGPFVVPLNAKAGSSSLSLAIIQRWHPVVYQSIVDAHYPDGKTMHDVRWHALCPYTKTPVVPVVLGVRDPVERFRSGVAYVNVDVDAAIDSLLHGTAIAKPRRTLMLSTDVHFKHQYQAGYGTTHLFRFSEHLEQMCELLDLNAVPTDNVTPRPKPTLTASQRQAVENYYSMDMALYADITQPNTIVEFAAGNTTE